MQTIETMPTGIFHRRKSGIKITYEDYREIPDNGKRHEIIDGELIMSPAPNMFHQNISLNIVYYLKDFLMRHPLGKLYEAPCDVVLNDTDVVQPDVLVVLNDNKHLITRDNVSGAPDFIIEIISASSRKMDLRVKKSLYETHQVKEYWIIDPDLETIQKFALIEGRFVDSGMYEREQTIASDVIKGFSIELVKVFAP